MSACDAEDTESVERFAAALRAYAASGDNREELLSAALALYNCGELLPEWCRVLVTELTGYTAELKRFSQAARRILRSIK